MKKILWVICVWMAFGILHAEDGRDAWLRYAPLKDAARSKYASLPASVVVLGDSPVLNKAQEELIRGIRGMLGRTLRAERESVKERAIVLGTTPTSLV
jgi:alpha-glucuronidase